jgi:hypothetical protein
LYLGEDIILFNLTDPHNHTIVQIIQGAHANQATAVQIAPDNNLTTADF